MSELKLSQRPLIEVVITDSDLDSMDDLTSETLISWLEDHASAPHRHETEYFMWIPPDMKYVDVEYQTDTDDVPQIIRDILVSAMEATQRSKDKGYILISIV